MDSLIYLLILLVALLIFSGFSSGSETGMMASNKVKLRHNSKKSRGARRALRLLARPDILLSAILVGNNFANILASSVVTIIFINYFGGNVLVGSVILTIVILIFSEITPKTIATVYPEKFAEKSSWILKGLIFLFKPIIALTNFISSRLLKLLNVDPADSAENDNLNSGELRTLLSEHGDLIPDQSRTMLSSILDLEDLTVEDIMIPAAEMVGIDLNNPDEAESIIKSSFYSRLPVFRGSFDNMIGVLHLKDSHEFIECIENNQSVDPFLSETYFVSQSTKLTQQLREFQNLDKNIGLVVDEYGEIEGLISIEDLFSEIVGKFNQQNLQKPDALNVRSDGSVIVEGNYKIRDLNKQLEWELPEDGSKTINGMIVDYLEYIPSTNLCMEINGYQLEILNIVENSIDKVKLKKGA
ncbi:CNNM domain-containing protein [Gammaproteobacteria bacterium]|nr:CNNM domain-containing protein [Gammaproteobacteria bacterium]